MAMKIKTRGSELGRFRSLSNDKERAEITTKIGMKWALFKTLPVYKRKTFASSAVRRLMSGPPDRLWRWDSSHGAPSWGDSGHFLTKKRGQKIHQNLVWNEPFFRLFRSIKEKHSLQQQKDWFQGLRIGSCSRGSGLTCFSRGTGPSRLFP